MCGASAPLIGLHLLKKAAQPPVGGFFLALYRLKAYFMNKSMRDMTRDAIAILSDSFS